jgi:hypothetical protein
MKQTIALSCVLLLAACTKSIKNSQGLSDVSPFTSVPTQTSTWVTVTDSTSFASYTNFDAHWNYLYPWGSDHNGSARMYGSDSDHSQIYLNGDGSLTLKATPDTDATPSSKSPYLAIHYHSGTIYSKHQIQVDTTYPYWEVSVDLQAPTTYGTWPAFWLTGVNTWPPESDIAEVKGSTAVWANTYTGSWQTHSTTVSDAATAWHNYKAVYNLLKNSDGSWSSNVEIQYFVDNNLVSVQTGTSFEGSPMWLIIDLQMEGSSGSPGPNYDIYYNIKDVTIRKGTTPFDPNSFYRLVNVNSGMVAAVPSASTTAGVTLIQWPWEGGNEQQWQIASVGTGTYALVNRNSGQVMDIRGSSTTEGASIVQNNYSAASSQWWSIADVGSGYYTVTNSHSSYVVDVSGGLKTQGDTLLQWAYHTGTNQQWEMVRQLP